MPAPVFLVVYREGTDKLTPAACPVCHLRRDACLCRRRPAIVSAARFQLLVHPRELRRPTNTGHLVSAAVISADHHVWSRRTPPPRLLAALAAAPQRTCLVFPQQEAAAAEVCEWPVRRRQFVILDGTWQEARKMLRQSPYLRQLPQLPLPAGLSSDYHLRRHQPRGHLATAEVAVALLRLLGERRQAADLEGYYRAFLQHFSASRSGHGVKP